MAKNEGLFRTLNENIVELAGTLGTATPYEFICECATNSCFERLLLTLGEYEAVRSDGTHFLVAGRHTERCQVGSRIRPGHPLGSRIRPGTPSPSDPEPLGTRVDALLVTCAEA